MSDVGAVGAALGQIAAGAGAVALAALQRRWLAAARGSGELAAIGRDPVRYLRFDPRTATKDRSPTRARSATQRAAGAGG